MSREVSITFDRVKAYLIALTFIPAVILILIFGSMYGWHRFSLETGSSGGLVFFFMVYVGSLFVHEIIHYLSFILFGGVSGEFIKFRCNIKKLTFSVICKSSVSARRYKYAVISPALILGMIPLIIGLMSSNLFIYLIGLLQITGSAGDLILFFLLLPFDGKERLNRTVGKVGFVTAS